MNGEGKKAAREQRDTGLGYNLSGTPYNMARKHGNAYLYFLVILAHLISREQPELSKWDGNYHQINLTHIHTHTHIQPLLI